MTTKPSILIVEDEEQLAKSLEIYLRQKGLEAICKKTGKSAKEYFELNNSSLHLVLMDIGLPDTHGIDLAHQFLEIKYCPIIFLSAQNDPEIRLRGLEIGAYDYVTKPFALKELLLRIHRLQKNEFLPPEQVQIGKLRLYFGQYLLEDAQGNQIKLTHKECSVLKMLYLAKGTVLSRDEIIDKVWGPDSYPSNRTIDNCIVKFRKWYESDPLALVHIESIRGIGYKMTFPPPQQSQVALH